MSWDKIYQKWGLSETAINALNIITWLVLAAGVIIGIYLILAGFVTLFKLHHSSETKDIIAMKKQRNKQFITGGLSLGLGIIWPILLTIFDAAGMGKITSGNFIPQTINDLFYIGV